MYSIKYIWIQCIFLTIGLLFLSSTSHNKQGVKGGTQKASSLENWKCVCECLCVCLRTHACVCVCVRACARADYSNKCWFGFAMQLQCNLQIIVTNGIVLLWSLQRIYAKPAPDQTLRATALTDHYEIHCVSQRHLFGADVNWELWYCSKRSIADWRQLIECMHLLL